jgi:hypothetical protein
MFVLARFEIRRHEWLMVKLAFDNTDEERIWTFCFQYLITSREKNLLDNKGQMLTHWHNMQPLNWLSSLWCWLLLIKLWVNKPNKYKKAPNWLIERNELIYVFLATDKSCGHSLVYVNIVESLRITHCLATREMCASVIASYSGSDIMKPRGKGYFWELEVMFFIDQFQQVLSINKEEGRY